MSVGGHGFVVGRHGMSVGRHGIVVGGQKSLSEVIAVQDFRENQNRWFLTCPLSGAFLDSRHGVVGIDTRLRGRVPPEEGGVYAARRGPLAIDTKPGKEITA